MWQWNPYAPWAAVTVLACGAMAWWVWRRSSSKASLDFVLVAGALMVEGSGLLLDLCAANLPLKQVGLFIQFVGFIFVPTTALRFALTNTGRSWMTWRVFWLLMTPGLALLVAFLTNDVHHTVDVSTELSPRDGFVMRNSVAGSAFWLFVAWAYLQVLLVAIIYGFETLYGSPLGRRHAVLLLLGTLIPWVTNVIFLKGWAPDPALDLTVFGYTATAILWAIAITRARMTELVPAARNLVFDRLVDPVVVLDQHGRFLDGNAAFAKLADEALEELPGHTLAAFGLGDALTADEFVRNGRVYSVGRSTLADGMEALVFRDVTERAEAEATQRRAALEAAALAKARTDFLARMSHEVRTPLYGILGAAELALDRPLDERARELLKAVQRSGSALVNVVDEILDFSKLDARQVRASIADFDLLQLVDDLLTIFLGVARGRNVELRAEVNAEARWIRSDSLRLRQVLTNLLSNALKFTEAGEVVLVVDVKRVGDGRCTVTIAVRDTGCGIAPDAQARIFEAFAQADDSVARKYGGTGLGLSIARGLVEALGGQLSLRSEVGKGSTFTLQLALEEGHAPRPEARRGSGTRAGTVLVVDDHLVGRTISRAMLEREGCSVELASSGEEAIAMVQPGRYALVFLDVRMPDIDGPEVFRRIRASGVDTPVVWLTADVLGSFPGASDAQGVLPKPFQAEALRAILDRFVKLTPAAESPLFPEVTEAFAESSERELNAISVALSRNDGNEIARLLHELKGSAGFAGATEVAAICSTGEDVGVMLPRLREARERELHRLRAAGAPGRNEADA
ncbi:MAG: histidine kinase N-terminal 7TM domain-containing protein [Archangium sp.]